MKFGKKMWSYIGIVSVVALIALIFVFSDKNISLEQSTEIEQIEQVESEEVAISPETLTLYETWWTKGLPLLEKYSLPAVFFISSGFIEACEKGSCWDFCRNNLKLPFSSSALTRDMVKNCAAHPLIEIGGHTRHHDFLPRLTGDSLSQDIAYDKMFLERCTEKILRVFAYPFGAVNQETQNSIKAFYSYAVTTKSDFYSPRDNPLLLPRSNHGTVSNLFLRLWILGAFDIVEKFFARTSGLFRKN